MSNGFEKHGIQHLSASSINLWTNAPDVWVAQYLFGMRGLMSAAAMRGICTEDAVVAHLTGKSDCKAALKAALDKFDKTFPIADEKTTKERAMIKPCMTLALEALADYGTPEFPEEGQEKISITAKGDDYEIPVIGFLDLVFPEAGLVIDLKTTGRCPSTMSAEHQLQRAIYQKAKGNQAVKFLYVTPKKTALLEDGDPNELLSKAKTQITRMERFLRSGTKHDIAGVIPVNPSTFYWNGAEAIREQLYGL